MALRNNLHDREYDAFKQDANYQTRKTVDALITNDASNPVPIVGDITADIESATTPKIYRVSCNVASTEYSQSLTDHTKQLLIRCDGKAKVRIAWASGETATKYFTIERGVTITESGLDLVGKTIYFSCDLNSQIVEIREWS